MEAHQYLIYVHNNDDFYEILMSGTVIKHLSKTSGSITRDVKFAELSEEVQDQIVSAVAEKLENPNG